MSDRSLLRNIWLLAACQGMLLCNGVTLIAINGLVGKRLAPSAELATLTITGYVIGTALLTLPASRFMQRFGRRAGFMFGSMLGIFGGLICGFAAHTGNFWLLCFGTLMAGAYNAFGLQYRFAAADMAPVDWKPKAISYTLAGGILGGFVGPALSNLTKNAWGQEFVATYLSLSAFALVALWISSLLTIPAPAAAVQAGREPGRPWFEIARQPVFLVAVLAAAVGYGTMNLLMAATPLAMDVCGFPFGDVAFVLQWHVLGMYLPSFFTGSLIRRVGVLWVLLMGAVLMLACIALAVSGLSLMHFWWALVLLGVGWNFLYIGGTTLLTESYRPAERAKVQGSNDFMVFGVQAVSSISAGALVLGQGWVALNLYALPAVILIAAITALFLRRRQKAAP